MFWLNCFSLKFAYLSNMNNPHISLEDTKFRFSINCKEVSIFYTYRIKNFRIKILTYSSSYKKHVSATILYLANIFYTFKHVLSEMIEAVSLYRVSLCPSSLRNKRIITETVTMTSKYIYIYTHTHLLTPWCRVLLEKLTGLQLVKKFPAFDGIRRFITALTSVRHLSLSWASAIQSIYPHPTSWRSFLIYK